MVSEKNPPVFTACQTCSMPYLHNFFPHHPLSSQPMEKHKYLTFMRFHGMAVLHYFAVDKTPSQRIKSGSHSPHFSFLSNVKPIKRQYLYQDFHLPSPLLAGSMQGGMANPLHSPKQGTLPSPCPSSGVLFRLPSPGRSIIMAPLRAFCHAKPRTGCRSLPSFFYYNPSVYPLQGRQIMAKLLVRRNLFKGKPLKAAAYWYSVFKFPTFRRKAQALKPVISIKDYKKFFYS